jgi:hypothetical protein
MSDAVDQAISQIDFKYLSGKKVFVDTLYLHSVKGVGFVNSEYIISSLRQQLTAAQCMIQDTRESADVIVEPRVGALGTDGHEVVYGIPQAGSITSAASILSNSPIPPIPEVSVGKSNALSGIAKVIVFAYDRETREPVWQSGIAKAESTSSNTWFLGAGPFQKGSIYEGMRFAGQQLPPPPHFDRLAKGNSSANVFPRLRSEGKSEAIEEHDPVFELETISPEPMVQYKREHYFDPGEPLEPIPAAVHPDEIADSSKSEAEDSGAKQASFAEAADK